MERSPSILLLDWYDSHARELPWRVLPGARDAGEVIDPYRVWLSEVMLQQTTVAAVKSYFERFTALWPTIQALASAPREDVLREWAGLGYYARARNLHKCAAIIAHDHNGRFPETEDGLRELPGIGAYTAAAIAAIAFEREAVVVDGNVERVMARYFKVEEPLPKSKPALRAYAARLTPSRRPGDYAQAVMDLGATICTPKSPACAICPLMESCSGRRSGLAATLPKKTPKSAKPTRRGLAYVAIRDDGAVYLQKRSDAGLLGGMTEVPGSEWCETSIAEPPENAPFEASWQEIGEVRHTFTHFHLVLRVLLGPVAGGDPEKGWWSHTPLKEALPTVMKKVVRLALPG